MTIYGWDASDFDWDRGKMDLAAARAAGIDFFTHKGTEGTSVVHRHLGEALKRGRDAGIPFLGAYCVVRTPGNSGHGTIDEQVTYFLDYIDKQAPWFWDFPGNFLQTDLEHWGYDNVSPANGVAFTEKCEAVSGLATILYAPQWAYGNTIKGTDALWASNYGSNPAIDFKTAYPGDDSPRWGMYSGRTPDILQYGSKTIIGTQKTCDANAYRGTVADFAKFIGKSAPPEEGDTMITLIRKKGETEVWAADGVTRTIVPAKSVAGKVSWLKGRYPESYSYKAGEITDVNDLDAFGREVSVTVTISDAQVSAIAAKLVDAHAGLSSDDLELIESKVKEALREGSGS